MPLGEKYKHMKVLFIDNTLLLISAECTLGYFGKFCNESCPPGRFGYRCGGWCAPECTAEYCNPVTGCHLISKTPTQLTMSGKEQKIKSILGRT